MALTDLAEAMDDDPRVRRVLEEADKLIAALPAGETGQHARGLVFLGRQWVGLDPARAVRHLERASEHIPLIEDEDAYRCAYQLAEAAAALAAADPIEAARLMSGLERVVAELDIDIDPPWLLPQHLGGIALAGQTADPVAAERLLHQAELAAQQTEDSATALRFLAAELAVTDLPRAELLVGRITHARSRNVGWATLIEAVGEHRPDLLDEVLEDSGFDRPVRPVAQAPNLDPVPPPPTGPSAQPTVPARGIRRFFRRTAPQSVETVQPAPPVAPTAPAEEGDPSSLWWVTAAAAPFAEDWAERVASRIISPYDRATAFHAMAAAVTEDRPLRAEQWLRRAYELLVESARAESAHPSPAEMGKIAQAAVTVAPDLAKDAAEYVARVDDEELKHMPWQLVDLAKHVAAIDPHGAIRIVSLIEKQADAPNDTERRGMAEAQIAAAATLARSNLGLAEQTIRRAARSLASMSDERADSVDWDPVAHLAVKQRDTARKLCQWALEEVQGETRDQIRVKLAWAFATVDLPHAEQLAVSIGDRSIRDLALSGIVDDLVPEPE
ncbi:hypothetical protein [Streptomyces brasiliensis]|nr:hypothetical protein [Streptomyces brasiliensis]